jgi:hypothetical protein
VGIGWRLARSAERRPELGRDGSEVEVVGWDSAPSGSERAARGPCSPCAAGVVCASLRPAAGPSKDHAAICRTQRVLLCRW